MRPGIEYALHMCDPGSEDEIGSIERRSRSSESEKPDPDDQIPSEKAGEHHRKTPQKRIPDLRRVGAGKSLRCGGDIYTVAEMLARQDDINVLMVKDYIRCPKVNGYRSYHMIIEVPVFFSDRRENMRVEVQIRTIAMDFWASLDHQMKYKKDVEDASEISDELKECAEVIAQTDLKMLALRRKIEDRESRENPLKFDKDLP